MKPSSGISYSFRSSHLRFSLTIRACCKSRGTTSSVIPAKPVAIVSSLRKLTIQQFQQVGKAVVPASAGMTGFHRGDGFCNRLIIPVFFLGLLLISCQTGLEPATPTTAAPASPASVAMTAEAVIFTSECSKCHMLRRALNTYKDEETWMKTIKRMQEQNKAQISSQQVEKLVRYHVERQKQENAVFKEKCQKCHLGSRYVEKAMTPEQARMVVRRMQEKAGNTIRDEDVELIVNYHVREHQGAVQKNLASSMGVEEKGPALDPEGLTLFVKKCTSCHEAEKAINVIKDELSWKLTVKKMQAYSRGFIAHEDVPRLTDFLMKRQKTEEQVFLETCMKCHTKDRITERSLTDAEWAEVVRQMQKKAPELITEDKIKVVASYHRKQESILTTLFYGQCGQCHAEAGTTMTTSGGGKSRARDILVTMASERFGGEISPPEIKELMTFHKERQQREMAVFGRECSQCHLPGQPRRGGRDKQEWLLLIANLQDKVYETKMDDSINTQIGYHVAAQRR